jgi:phage terminase large subunit-like protein
MRGGKGAGARPGAFKVKDLYPIDLIRRRIEYPELKRELHAQHERFRPGVVLIENRGSGTQLSQELIAAAHRLGTFDLAARASGRLDLTTNDLYHL